jgi:hypothetical protein
LRVAYRERLAGIITRFTHGLCGWPRLTLKRAGFEVAQPLDQDGFFHFDRFQKLSELSRGDDKLSGMVLTALPQLLAGQVDFTFRTPVQNRVAL